MLKTPKHQSITKSGFTLVELLVSIAIILLLLGILLPSLKAILQRGGTTAAKAQLSGLANASETYSTDFRAYPGYFSEREMQVKSIYKNALTPNQNMLLSLVGGVMHEDDVDTSDKYSVNALEGKLTIDRNYSDGPISNAQDINKQRKFAAYYSPKKSELLKITGGAYTSMEKATTPPALVDPINKQPVLYFRALKNDKKPADYIAASTSGQDNAVYGLSLQAYYLESTKTEGTLYSNARNQLQSKRSLVSKLASSQSNAANNFAWLVVNTEISKIDPKQSNSHNEDYDEAKGGVFFYSAGQDGIFMSNRHMDSTFSDKTAIKLLPEFERYREKSDDVYLSSGTR